MNMSSLYRCISTLSSSAACAAVLSVMAGQALAVPVIVANSGAGVTTDIFDIAQGGQIAFGSNPLSNAFPLVNTIGGTGSGGESGDRTLFTDGAGIGTASTIRFQTASHVNLSSIALRLAQDGASNSRAAISYTLRASGDGINFSTISTAGGLSNYNDNFGGGQILITDTVNTSNVRYFELEVTRATTNGPRLIELDGFGSLGQAQTIHVNPILLNASTNLLSENDEAPGLVTSFAVTSALAGDNPADAFGNNNGPVEGNTFLFADNGAGTDTIQFTTASPVTLAGLQILAGASGPTAGDPRRIGQLSIEGDLDNNGSFETTLFTVADFPDQASPNLFLFNQIVTASRFQVTVQGIDSSGPRIAEINAILPAAVPEPAMMSLLGLAGLALVRRRRTHA